MNDKTIAHYLEIPKENMGTWERIPKVIKRAIQKIVMDKISMEEDLAEVIGDSLDKRLKLMNFGSTRENTSIPASTVIRFILNKETDAYVDLSLNGDDTIEIFSTKKMFISPRTANIAEIKVAMGMGFDGTQKPKKGGRPRAGSSA